jgi:hypothetical protein
MPISNTKENNRKRIKEEDMPQKEHGKEETNEGNELGTHGM